MLQKLLILLISIVFSTMMGCNSSAPTPTSIPIATQVSQGIVIGTISDEPAKKVNNFQPLANYLAAHLADFGIGVGNVKIAPDVETMAQWLKSGAVDLYIDTLYPTMIVAEQSGAQSILCSREDSITGYRTVFFATTTSGLLSITDLKGHMLALEGNFSTVGYMLPMAYLTETGLKPIEKQSVAATVSPNEVGYVFSSNDMNTIQWVIRNKVTAGVVSSQNFQNIPSETRSQLTILAETEIVPRQIIMARPGMQADLLKAIKTKFIEINQTEDGKRALESLGKTTQFDEFPGKEMTLARMQELYKLIKHQ